MSSDPNDRPEPPDAHLESDGPAERPHDTPEETASASPQQAPDAAPAPEPTASEQSASTPTDPDAESGPKPPRRRQILIGSQRDVAAYRPKPKRDSIPVVGLKPRTPRTPQKRKPTPEPETEAPDQTEPPRRESPAEPSTQPPAQARPGPEQHVAAKPEPESAPPAPVQEDADAVQHQAAVLREEADTLQQRADAVQRQAETLQQQADALQQQADAVEAPPAPTQEATAPTQETTTPTQETTTPTQETTPPQELIPPEADDIEQIEQDLPAEPVVGKRFPLPNIRDRLPPDLEEQFQEALADVPLDELITDHDEVTRQALLEPESEHVGRVVMARREDVFVELGGREQGVLPTKQFAEPPEVGAEVKVRVIRFNRDEGLYELTRPGAAANVGDWSDLEEGMVVEAKVTGHNSGGLECDVNRIRGFIPISQISLYRVENLAEFVDEKLSCLVTECNPERRNLVLSRRALLEREREEARRDLLESLEPGQIREGVVRKLVDFGAFVDLGGVDGLLPISRLAWGRVSHPSEVLHEGQTIKVSVQHVDKATQRISLSYRDMLENPWTDVETKYPVNSPVRGKVTRLVEFGAFVELEPGVEGLVHISELAHKRVWRVSDVVKEGEEVDVMVVKVDAQAQRIGLSMKGLIPEPKPSGKADSKDTAEPETPPPPPKQKRKPDKPLKGGLGRSPGGDQFGLKW